VLKGEGLPHKNLKRVRLMNAALFSLDRLAEIRINFLDFVRGGDG